MPLIISHRANLDGPVLQNENNPINIDLMIEAGFYVEVDIQDFITNKGKTYCILGHDKPEYVILLEFLQRRNIICHCKTIKALSFLIDKVHCFFHDTDNVTLTSEKLLWTYPGKPIKRNSILVLPEKYMRIIDLPYLSPQPYGICTDYPLQVKKIYEDYNLGNTLASPLAPTPK